MKTKSNLYGEDSISRRISITKLFILIVLILLLHGTSAFGCPKGYYKDSLTGICLPKIGGVVGNATEKAKKEVNNFVKDAEVLVKTGKCGGDICDALGATLEFKKANVKDAGKSFAKATERISEGKHIDALWHLFTDSITNVQENAADAAQKSSLLAATGQVAATVYGGTYGAAAYTAWLTYHYSNGDIAAALKAGIISGASAYALAEVGKIGSDYHATLDLVQQVAYKSILTGAINGTAVALAGGKEDDVREAIGMGVLTVLIREGYRELTSFDLDNNRLKSSTGEAYCLAEIPPESYFNETIPGGCFAPQEAYKLNPDGSLKMKGGKPEIRLKKLDPNRPHVGQVSKKEPSFFGTGERSAVMTGVSRLPGWNAMAVAHDQLAANLEVGILPLDLITNQGTIASAVVLTYIGSGVYVHDMIRNESLRSKSEDVKESAKIAKKPIITNKSSLIDEETKFTTEVTHIICDNNDVAPSDAQESSFDLVIRSSISDYLESKGNMRLCEIDQKINDQWYKIGHSHYQLNYCHERAEKIVRRWMHRKYTCSISVGAE